MSQANNRFGDIISQILGQQYQPMQGPNLGRGRSGVLTPGSNPQTSGLMRYFVDAQNAANQANDERYRGAIGLTAGMGEDSRTRIRRDANEARAQGQQSLINRGLFNTSVLDAQNRRIDEARDRSLTAVDESVADRVAGIMERRTDQAPSMDLLAQLAMQGQQGGTGGMRARQTTTAPRGPNSFLPPGFGGEGGGGAGGGGAGSGGGMGGGGGGGGGGGRRGGTNHYTNPNAGPAGRRATPCGFFKTRGCMLPSGAIWSPDQGGIGSRGRVGGGGRRGSGVARS